jgi:predicted DNA-binding transcriptional regulator YafY
LVTVASTTDRGARQVLVAEDRFERLANLVTFLLAAGEGAGPGATYADIVAGIPGYPEGDEARRRAFERDKKLLRDEDIPLVEQDGRYRIPPDEYYLPDLGLTEEEQLALHLAVAAVPVGAEGDALEGLQKLTLGAPVDGGLAASVAAGAALADLDEHPLLPVLHAAIRSRATVTFDRAGERRTVEPAALFFREGRWYLFGNDRLRDADRNFRVDRIGSVEVGPPGAFERRAGSRLPSPSEAMPSQEWLYGGDAGEEATWEAVVQVDAVLAAKAVADAGGTAAAEWSDEDGSVTLTMPVRDVPNFREWVLGLLDHALVVGPAELRTDVVSWLRGMAG